MLYYAVAIRQRLYYTVLYCTMQCYTAYCTMQYGCSCHRHSATLYYTGLPLSSNRCVQYYTGPCYFFSVPLQYYTVRCNSFVFSSKFPDFLGIILVPTTFSDLPPPEPSLTTSPPTHGTSKSRKLALIRKDRRLSIARLFFVF